MARSTDYIGYTCVKAIKAVKAKDFSDLAAEVTAGDTPIEEALLEAALRGADTAQLFGAEQVRGAFDSYIRDVESILTDEQKGQLALLRDKYLRKVPIKTK